MRIEAIRTTLAFLVLYGSVACAPRQIESKDIAGKDPTPVISATQTPEPLPTPIPTPTETKPKETTSLEFATLLEKLNRKYREDLRQNVVSPIINLCRALPEIRMEQATGRLDWPTYGYISQGFSPDFSPPHTGIDIVPGYGKPVYAADGGIVAGTFFNPYGLGWHILLFHGNGKMTVYGHFSEIRVATGQYIEEGEGIGKTGTTGRTSGPHLHFETLVGCEYMDPRKLLPR